MRKYPTSGILIVGFLCPNLGVESLLTGLRKHNSSLEARLDESDEICFAEWREAGYSGWWRSIVYNHDCGQRIEKRVETRNEKENKK